MLEQEVQEVEDIVDAEILGAVDVELRKRGFDDLVGFSDFGGAGRFIPNLVTYDLSLGLSDVFNIRIEKQNVRPERAYLVSVSAKLQDSSKEVLEIFPVEMSVISGELPFNTVKRFGSASKHGSSNRYFCEGYEVVLDPHETPTRCTKALVAVIDAVYEMLESNLLRQYDLFF
ncbi:MAG: hypothetical protein ABIE94_01185 [archaeon]